MTAGSQERSACATPSDDTGISENEVKVDALTSDEDDEVNVSDAPSISQQHSSDFFGPGKADCRWAIRHYVMTIEVQIFMVLVVVVDVICQIAEFIREEQGDMTHEEEKAFLWITIVALGLCALETVLKIIGFGICHFVRDPWMVFDLVVISFALALIGGEGDLIVGVRFTKVVRHVRTLKMLRNIIRLLRCLRFVGRARPMKRAVKQKVSQNKLRYQNVKENLDLDLTYITRDLIAMGVPVIGCFHSFYRNPIRDVVRFFKLRHEGLFRIYNACPELPYPDDRFQKIGGQVVRFQIQDHTPPTMDQYVQFLTNAREHIGADEERRHILAVHCKAGKGRTGAICCAWLMYSKRADSAQAALRLFALRRTDARFGKKLRGVETPSQVRYVHQLARHLKETNAWLSSEQPPPRCPEPSLALLSLDIQPGLLAKANKMKPIRCLVQCGGENVSALVLETGPFEPSTLSIPLNDCVVKGDVRVSIFQEKKPGFNAHEAMTSATNADRAKGIVLFFLFHTNFVEAPDSGKDGAGKFRVAVEDLDRAHKGVKKGKHAAGSCVVLNYSMASGTESLPGGLTMCDHAPMPATTSKEDPEDQDRLRAL